jgi:hypothetical protein
MKLPIITYPTFTINVPPTNKPFPFRPMLVKEEKLLLMAKQSEDPTSILSTIKQVVNNCSLDPAFIVDMIPLFALEFIFIKLRAASVGKDIEVSYRDFDDQKTYPFMIDLDKVQIKYPDPVPSHKIAITQTSGIALKYPPAALYDDKIFLATEGDDSFYSLIIKCIDQVYDGDNVYNGADFKYEDLAEFLELLDIKSFDKIREFMLNLPTLYYKLTYVNENKEEKVIELSTLSDFFTLH